MVKLQGQRYTWLQSRNGGVGELSMNRIVNLMHWHVTFLFLLMYVSCCLDLPTVLSSWETLGKVGGGSWVGGLGKVRVGH